MNSILKAIKNYYTVYTMFLVVGSGLVSYFIDYQDMKRKKYNKEAKISKTIGTIYIFGGIILFILASFID
ncbi:MAG TPA: hypothetical protein GXZ78_04920 [Eubacteriaceae bacterium]|nr:hypothetical protein [Eubacteriaceae bacterium]